MNINLNEKVIVITGSSRGIGSKLACAFLYEGAHVVMNYHRSNGSAIELYQRMSSQFDCMMIEADISNAMQAQNLVELAYKRYGRIDVLINNAGINCDSDILDMNDSQWNTVIQTNLTGTFYCSRAALQYMSRQRTGKIVNIGSLIGTRGRSGQANYSASKSALVGLTKSLAMEAAKYNISVNLVCPGFILTDLNRKNIKKQEQAERQSVLSSESSYDDLENMLLLLLSDKICGISGQVFHLDSRIY